MQLELHSKIVDIDQEMFLKLDVNLCFHCRTPNNRFNLGFVFLCSYMYKNAMKYTVEIKMFKIFLNPL